MSLILKGIDLDEITAGNGYARLEIEEDGTVVDDISDIIIAQAIQIDRPHGRLIDGDEIATILDARTSGKACLLTKEMPTIIEAEE